MHAFAEKPEKLGAIDAAMIAKIERFFALESPARYGLTDLLAALQRKPLLNEQWVCDGCEWKIFVCRM